MTKELEQKIYRMLKSTDIEWVFLGIQLLLNNATQHECMKMIPWNSLRHGALQYVFKQEGENWTRDPFELNILEYIDGVRQLEYYTIYIKGNIAITIQSGSLICRRLGLMKCLFDFEKRPKVIYDAG